jgi:hypothetical protein
MAACQRESIASCRDWWLLLLIVISRVESSLSSQAMTTESHSLRYHRCNVNVTGSFVRLNNSCDPSLLWIVRYSQAVFRIVCYCKPAMRCVACHHKLSLA